MADDDVRAAKDLIARNMMGMAGPSQVVRPVRKAASNGESEIEESVDDHKELLTLSHLVPKVLAQDLKEVVLDKGLWAATPAVHRGWKIFVLVGTFLTSFEAVADRVDPGCLGLESTDLPAVCDPET